MLSIRAETAEEGRGGLCEITPATPAQSARRQALATPCGIKYSAQPSALASGLGFLRFCRFPGGRKGCGQQSQLPGCCVPGSGLCAHKHNPIWLSLTTAWPSFQWGTAECQGPAEAPATALPQPCAPQKPHDHRKGKGHPSHRVLGKPPS